MLVTLLFQYGCSIQTGKAAMIFSTRWEAGSMCKAVNGREASNVVLGVVERESRRIVLLEWLRDRPDELEWWRERPVVVFCWRNGGKRDHMRLNGGERDLKHRFVRVVERERDQMLDYRFPVFFYI